MLTIARDLLDRVIAHARADHPDEACGVIAGPAGSDRPERFVAMTNAERSPTFYRFDSMEQLQVWASTTSASGAMRATASMVSAASVTAMAGGARVRPGPRSSAFDTPRNARCSATCTAV